MKDKKGTVLLWISIFGIIAAAGIFFILTITKQEVKTYKGEQELELLEIYNEAEEILFYVDQSAKYAIPKSIKELAENGGFYNASPCGNYLGYNVWGENCFPDYKESLKFFIKKYFNPYLENSPSGNISTDYNYLILDKNIAGIANFNLHFYTPFPGRIEYYFKPSFNIPIEQGVTEYNILIEQARLLLVGCSNSSNLAKCIEEKKQNNWQLGTCEGDKIVSNRKAAFCVKLNGLTYKFAFYIPIK